MSRLSPLPFDPADDPEGVVAGVVFDPATRRWMTVRLPKKPWPLKVSAGDRYWLRVLDDDTEKAVCLQAEHGDRGVTGALSVLVLAVDGPVIDEETYTRSLPPLGSRKEPYAVRPPGRGWFCQDCSEPDHTVWRRKRKWVVLA